MEESFKYADIQQAMMVKDLTEWGMVTHSGYFQIQEIIMLNY